LNSDAFRAYKNPLKGPLETCSRWFFNSTFVWDKNTKALNQKAFINDARQKGYDSKVNGI